MEGRQAFYVNNDGIQFLGACPEPPKIDPIDPDEEAELIWPLA